MSVVTIPSCSLCGSKAVFQDRVDGKCYCESCFKNYFELKIRGVLSRYGMLVGVERLLVCVSGGKDSVALVNALVGVIGDSVEIIGLHINLGIKGYSESSMNNAVEAFRKAGVKDYIIIDLQREYGFTIDDLRENLKTLNRPLCSLCGMVKRYLMNKAALEASADAVATGHNLDDLLAQMIHSISTGRLSEAFKLKPVSEGRGRLKRRIKPLAFTQAVESMIYVYTQNLPFQRSPCPYSTGAFRRRIYIVEGLCEAEDLRPGFKESLYKNMLELTSRISCGDEEYRECRICGMPSRSDVCSFCKLLMKLERMGVLK